MAAPPWRLDPVSTPSFRAAPPNGPHMPSFDPCADNSYLRHGMPFEWDRARDRTDVARYGMHFTMAQWCLDGPMLTRSDGRRHLEDAVIAVAHAARGGCVEQYCPSDPGARSCCKAGTAQMRLCGREGNGMQLGSNSDPSQSGLGRVLKDAKRSGSGRRFGRDPGSGTDRVVWETHLDAG